MSQSIRWHTKTMSQSICWYSKTSQSICWYSKTSQSICWHSKTMNQSICWHNKTSQFICWHSKTMSQYICWHTKTKSKRWTEHCGSTHGHWLVSRVQNLWHHLISISQPLSVGVPAQQTNRFMSCKRSSSLFGLVRNEKLLFKRAST